MHPHRAHVQGTSYALMYRKMKGNDANFRETRVRAQRWRASTRLSLSLSLSIYIYIYLYHNQKRMKKRANTTIRPQKKAKGSLFRKLPQRAALPRALCILERIEGARATASERERKRERIGGGSSMRLLPNDFSARVCAVTRVNIHAHRPTKRLDFFCL